MKFLLTSKRSRAILGIGIIAIGIGAISKKVISYPSGGCIKGSQEMVFNIRNKQLLYLRNRRFIEVNRLGNAVLISEPFFSNVSKFS